MSFSVILVVFYKILRIKNKSFLSHSYNPTFRIMAFLSKFLAYEAKSGCTSYG